MSTHDSGDACNGNSFSTLHQNDCLCPGNIVTFECTIVGFGSTVWRGGAFDCPLGQISLRHSQFASGSAVGECNNGAIIGRSVRVQNNDCFVSQLNVTLLSSLNGRTVECAHDDTTAITVIGSTILNIISSK